MDTLEQTARVGTARGAGVFFVGVLVAAWIAFGRFLFGVGGDLTVVYLLIGVGVVALHAFIARALVRAQARGFRVRPAVWGTLFAAWACSILLGLTIPDHTADGLQTILSGTGQPLLDFAIGIANPAGIIAAALTIIALVLASLDARGPRPSEDF